jgi:predicted O-linked N-acetylglucosamine transferase (SPINDLY family)
LPRDTSVIPSPATPKRSDFGLPEKGFVFCSFNHDYKINPPMFTVWMELLKGVPGSVLWLMKLNDAAQANLTNEAVKHGVDPDRMIYATRVPNVEDHLARYRLADLFLDTFPYNGHTTVGDALRAALPVVTLRGNSFASRVASSLLHDVGLPKYACNTLEEYHSTANRLVLNLQERLEITSALSKKITISEWPPKIKVQGEAFMDLIDKLSNL